MAAVTCVGVEEPSGNKPSGKDVPIGHLRGKLTVAFGDVTINSDFDSGNLDRVEECKSEYPDTYEFNLWTAPDCAGTEYETSNRSWFYYSVSTPPNFSGKTMRFNIQNMNRQTRLYQQGMTPLIKSVPRRGSWERLRDRPEYETVESGMRLSFQHTIADNRKVTTYFAFCYPFSYSECQKKLARLDERFAKPSNVDIYYHRELLCYSLEGLCVDLLTVSSHEGVTEDREPRLPNLFPDASQERPRTFKGKKVIFVSSRVHPGETPSSHVFNGFLDFILRPDDPRAQALRKLYVFKLIPMLNPDGVYRGHYRMDSRGVNLNRMYLNPNPKLHPTIYAARCLVLHYHRSGGNMQGTLQGLTSVPACIKTFSSSEIAPSKCHLAISECKGAHERRDSDKRSTLDSSQNYCSLSSSSVPTVSVVSNCHKVSADQNKRVMRSPGSHHDHFSLAASCNGKRSVEPSGSDTSLYTISNRSEDFSLAHLPKLRRRSSSAPNNPESSQSNSVCLSRDHTSSLSSDSSSSTSNCQPDALRITKESGIAFYIDLHAHATKRGCFIYGNYFRDETEQTQNMLFPKLVALNSPHLDFDQCVFSERNMYTSDKRDGMSKEGSGRVGIHKATGIIHSYTLECNYNCGRQCNAVSTATMDNGKASPPHPPSPMAHKYSIADYEQVGHALAVAALDMCQANPWSRLPTGEYGCLAGVRQDVMLRIRNSRAKKSLLPAEPQAPSTVLNPETKNAKDTVGSLAVQTSRNWERFLPTSMRSEQIAADISLLTEMRLAQHQSSVPKVAGRRLLLRRGSRPTGLKKEKQPPQPVKPALRSMVFPSAALHVSAEKALRTNPGRYSSSHNTPPPNLVTSKGGQSFWIKINGSGQKQSAKISDHNLLGSRCKLGIRRGGCCTGTRLLPLMQHRRKVHAAGSHADAAETSFFINSSTVIPSD